MPAAASMGIRRRQLHVYTKGIYVNCGGSGLQDILKNKKIIAVNQDPLGIQGRRIYKQKGETAFLHLDNNLFNHCKNISRQSANTLSGH